MTEKEWLACRDPGEMIDFLGKDINDRKLRLFQIACCRRIWEQLPGVAYREAVVVAEQYADGQTTDKKRVAARKRISTLREKASLIEINACYAAFETLEKTVIRQGRSGVRGGRGAGRGQGRAWEKRSLQSGAPSRASGGGRLHALFIRQPVQADRAQGQVEDGGCDRARRRRVRAA